MVQETDPRLDTDDLGSVRWMHIQRQSALYACLIGFALNRGSTDCSRRRHIAHDLEAVEKV